NNASPGPDVEPAGTSNFYLIGGAGCLSDSNSRLINYSGIESQAQTGTLLDSFTRTNENENWVYFNGVSPSQGEHIGNKYYFKIVVEVTAGTRKNAYQVDISYSNSGNPTSVTNVKTFAYNWCISLTDDPTHIWNIYPLVPEGSEGNNLQVITHDMDSGESMELYDKSSVQQAPDPTPSGNGVQNTDNYAIVVAETNGTWQLVITEVNDNAGQGENTTEFWFTRDDTGEFLRAYSADYDPPVADHVALSDEDGIAQADGVDLEQITLQIVDGSNTPLPYSYNVYVTVNGSALIDSSNNSTGAGSINANNTVVTTASDGIGWIKVKDGTAETVTVTLTTDGTNGSDNFGAGADDTITIDFQTNPPPTMSSSGNMTFTVGDPATAINVITITNSPVTNSITTGNDISIQIPAGLDCIFNPAANTPTFGGTASGNVAGTVTFSGGNKIMTIDVTTNFATNDTLTIDGLQFQTFASESSGSLTMSYDGGSTYSVTDDKVYSILDVNPPTIVSRQTVDLDVDGQIDAIHITFSKNIDDTTVTAGDFDVSVYIGEAFSSTTNGYTANDNDIYITFTESGSSDTAATPTLQYTAGTLTDLTGNALANDGPTACLDAAPAAITGYTLAADNSTISVDFSEPIYGDAGASTPIAAGDFTLVFNQNGGTATNCVIAGLSGAYVGGETTVTFNLTVTGSPSGVEDITIGSANDTSVYDAQGNPTLTTETTGVVLLNGTITAPVISDTRAVNGADQIYVEFDQAVQNAGGGTLTAANFNYNNVYAAGITVSGVTDISSGSNPQTQYILTVSTVLTDEHIVSDSINSVNIENPSSLAMNGGINYAVSSLGINFFYQVNAEDFVHKGTSWQINDFDGSEQIDIQSLRVLADVNINIVPYDTATPVLYYDVFNNTSSAEFWTPASNSDAVAVTGTSTGGNSWRFQISDNDARLEDGKILSFVFRINGLDCYRSKKDVSSSGFSPYDAHTYMITLNEIKDQGQNVNILNNVINPNNGDKVSFVYELDRSGPVSIMVYDLSRNLVMVLKSETESAGKHSVTWNGKNNHGKIVARGVYFIRIRAPGISNQIRKVLVIK
ncbi:MAG: hypothetical protein MJB14_07140, partial [Spirochaetes bacterium]|nr:hypothetical protein [Spirochaetota bacterium]